MNLPHILEKFLQKPEAKREVFLTLILQSDFVQAGSWHIKEDGTPHMLGSSLHVVAHDSWEERLEASDGAISTLPSIEGEDIVKVVLGLHSSYLTPSGDIDKHVRVEMKKLTKDLHLQPVGFVSLPQALIYKMKKEEGTPPSVILIGVSGRELCISLYKIATRVAEQSIDTNGKGIAEHIDETLANFPDAEILPSRILLYGAQPQDLEDVKRELLRFPWQSKPNFMHFPKIECIPSDVLIESVSYAGASELATSMKDEELEPVAEETKNSLKEPEMLQDSKDKTEHASGLFSEDELISQKQKEDITKAVYAENGEKIEDKTLQQKTENYQEMKESDVVVVDPESLGFSKEKVDTRVPHISDEFDKTDDTEKAIDTPSKMSTLVVSIHDFFSRITIFKNTSWLTTSMLPVLGVFALLVLGFFLVYWFIPVATVTILETLKPISISSAVIIDPGATSIDGQTGVIPGKKQEKTLTGEKTIDVSGKKQVGDQAKGVVTIYNKSIASKALKKGSILLSGSLSFTLDDDVSVASATESIGSMTFGKSSGAITARAIGGQSNLSENSEFLFKEFSDVVARNEKQLSGGTSRDVTVVTRADQDALVKSVTTDLLESAKNELGSQILGGEQMIDDTVKTQVSAKSFLQELDQEATQLKGKVTLTVSGVSFSRPDLSSLLHDTLDKEIADGYRLASKEPEASLSGVKITKDGKISTHVVYSATTEPIIDVSEVLKSIVGKSISDVQKYLESKKGIAGVVFDIKRWFWNDRLPINRKNIEVRIETQ
ncbi:hypothetical protein HY947_07005 [Candidatus Gottesmanbacteria bacterium]|nr:hypothetical protein [Candidatus Gottesmanbacteria bacterium]